MAKTTGESIVDAIIGLIDGPLGVVSKLGKTYLFEQISEWWQEQKTREQLLSAAQGAEIDTKTRYLAQFGNDRFSQALASYPVSKNPVFQHALRHLLDHLHERYLAEILDRKIANSDDLVDALCLAVVSKLGFKYGYQKINGSSLKDDKNIDMYMYYFDPLKHEISKSIFLSPV